MSLSPGDVFTLDYAHPNQTGRTTRRLAIVIQVIDSQTVLIVPTTTKFNPARPAHRRFRVLIDNWATVPFDQKTYAKVDPYSFLDVSAVRNVIGKLDVNDLNKVIVRMNQIAMAKVRGAGR